MRVLGGMGARGVAGVGVSVALIAGLSCSAMPGTSLTEQGVNANGPIALPGVGAGGDATAAAGTSSPGIAQPVNDMGSGGSVGFADAMEIVEPTGMTLTEGDSCGAVTAETEPVIVETVVETEVTTEVPAPVAVYFVLDNSMSMSNVGADTKTRWEEAVEAITAFVNDAGSAGLSAGIQYFYPPEARAADGDPCDGTYQAIPAAPMALLPANATPIIDSLANTPLIQSTPTPGALTGGIDYCVQYELDNPGTQCIVLLITDGVPSACGLSSACTAGAAGAGAGGGECVDPLAEGILVPIAQAGATAGVSTFAVGMEGVPVEGFAMLDAIAVAGGTDCTPGAAGEEACNVTTTGPAGFLEAFNVIRETISTTEVVTEIVTETVTEALECEWVIPPPADPKEPIEFDLVNLQLTIPGAEPTPIGYVEELANCGTVGGWHYNLTEPPTSIIACPATCTTIQEAEMPVINILLGCESEPPKLD